MGREFNGTSSYLTRTDALGITGYPVSMFCWFKADTTNVARCLMGLFEDNSSGSSNQLKVGTATDATIQSATYDPTNGFRYTSTTTTVTTGAWQNCLAVFTSATSRAVYLNGGGKATTTTTAAVDFSLLNRFTVGAAKTNNVTDYADGQIMFPTVWTAALNDEDALALNSGIIPVRVRPASVVGHWSVGGYYNV